MRLSEAIRKGATIRPQTFNDYWNSLDDGYMVGTCALGAALEAVGIPLQAMCEDAVRLHFPETRRSWESVPGVITLSDEIEYRNDTLHQTREEIADWLQEQGY